MVCVLVVEVTSKELLGSVSGERDGHTLHSEASTYDWEVDSTVVDGLSFLEDVADSLLPESDLTLGVEKRGSSSDEMNSLDIGENMVQGLLRNIERHNKRHSTSLSDVTSVRFRDVTPVSLSLVVLIVQGVRSWDGDHSN